MLRKIEDESPDPQANFVNFPPVRPRLWVHDLLGNGQDGLVWYDGRRVRAMQATAKGMLWEWERPTSPTATGYLAYPICGIQPAGKGFPATIAVASFNGMVGLAGPTGKVRWRCDDAHVDVSSVLDTDDPQGLPRILSLGPGSAERAIWPSRPTIVVVTFCRSRRRGNTTHRSSTAAFCIGFPGIGRTACRASKRIGPALGSLF